jgi:hypothetical protein
MANPHDDMRARCELAVEMYGPEAWACFTQQKGVTKLGPGSPEGKRESHVDWGQINSYRAREVLDWLAPEDAAA